MDSPGITDNQVTAKAGKKEWLGLAVLTLPTLLVSMDMTVMYLVVPAVSESLRPGSAELLWITDIYGFLEAGLLITMGTVGDRIGRRRLLFIGGTAFALASLLTAYSATVGMLIAARALLGMAGASLLPSTLSLIRNLFYDHKQRTQALGIFTTTFSAGIMIGPLIGGVLVNHFGWGSVFLIAVPVMGLFLLLAPFLLPEFKDPVAGRFDILSAALSIIAVLSGIYGIKQLAEQGVHSLSFLFILAGIITAILFYQRQKKITDPLIDLRLFRDKAFTTTLLCMFIALFCWAGLFLFISQELQLIIGLDAFHAGLWSIFGAAGSVISCSLVPLLVGYIHRIYLLITGLLIMATGMLIMSAMASQSFTLTLLITSLVLLSSGCGIAVTLGHDIVMSRANPQQAGAAASLTETCTTFGGALGIALLGSIGTAIYRAGVGNALSGDMPPSIIESAQTTLGGALVTAEKLPLPLQTQIVNSAHTAFGHSFNAVAGISALLMIGMAIIVFVRMKRPGE
jgi:DHA2 family multidrug resistance protein-like MFS transporter